MKKLLMLGWIGALLVALLAYPLAAILASGAVECYLIAANSPSSVIAEKATFDPPKAPKDSLPYIKAVIGIYGLTADYEKTPVVFVDAAKFIRPEELPSITLLPVDKQKGENPLQVKTLYFFASRVAVGAGIAAALLLVLWKLVGKKKAPAPAA